MNGNIYASNYLAGTPALMTDVISDMELAYTDAQGRAIPDYTELGAGDITGMTLEGGLYKWSSGVLISAGGVTLDGSATSVWIFQIAQDLTVASGAVVTLTGGALNSNVFWAVAGQATLGTTAIVEGTILSQTLISMNAGAEIHGRAFAQTAVTMDDNDVTIPNTVPIIPPPTVIYTNPIDDETAVVVNVGVEATFSILMNEATINNETFILKRGLTIVDGDVTYEGSTATFTPTNDLAVDTLYTARITNDVESVAGINMVVDYIWAFTTGAQAGGNIEGYVVGENGLPIEGATVSVVGGTQYDLTDIEGFYYISNVISGDQRLAVIADGYDRQVVDITVEADDTTVIDDIVLVKTSAIIEVIQDNWVWIGILACIAVIGVAGYWYYYYYRKRQYKGL